MSAAVSAPPLPTLQIRGRSFMALILLPEAPLEPWLAALDEQLARAASYFTNKPVVVNLSQLVEPEAHLLPLLGALESRGLKIVSVEHGPAGLLAETKWATLPDLRPRTEGEDSALAIPDDALPPPSGNSLVIDKPVRSGQQIMWEHGDVVVLGALASGAEIVAGGSIHIYGALRGRAIAGMREGLEAHIFCRKLEAELLAIDGIYETAEDWDGKLNGKPAHIRLIDGKLHYAPLA